MSKTKAKKLEAVLWNIALPGFTQLLNGSLFKGVLFIFLEIIINVRSNFNLAIKHSFLGEIDKAVETTDFQWLMFYPCLYMFAMWDGYRDAEAEEGDSSLTYLPFVFGAFLVTVGLMYSTKMKIFGILLGPVFLPMLFLIPGLFIGFIVQIIVKKASPAR